MITHKIFHIRVGAEQCWEEVEGFVSDDTSEIILKKNNFVKQNNFAIHPLSRIAENLGGAIYGGWINEKDFHIVLPTFIKTLVGTNLYTDFMVGDYGYKHGLGKGIFCFGGYRWENSDLDGYVENNEEDKPVFCGFHWLRSRGGDLDRLPSPQYNDFKVEGNIFKDYAETGKIKDDLTIFTI